MYLPEVPRAVDISSGMDEKDSFRSLKEQIEENFRTSEENSRRKKRRELENHKRILSSGSSRKFPNPRREVKDKKNKKVENFEYEINKIKQQVLTIQSSSATETKARMSKAKSNNEKLSSSNSNVETEIVFQNNNYHPQFKAAIGVIAGLRGDDSGVRMVRMTDMLQPGH